MRSSIYSLKGISMANISKITGTVNVKDTCGIIKNVEVGYEIKSGDIIISNSNSVIEIDGKEISLLQEREYELSNNDDVLELLEPEADKLTDIDKIIESFNDGEMQETAAGFGDESNDNHGSNYLHDEIHDSVSVDRVAYLDSDIKYDYTFDSSNELPSVFKYNRVDSFNDYIPSQKHTIEDKTNTNVVTNIVHDVDTSTISTSNWDNSDKPQTNENSDNTTSVVDNSVHNTETPTTNTVIVQEKPTDLSSNNNQNTNDNNTQVADVTEDNSAHSDNTQNQNTVENTQEETVTGDLNTPNNTDTPSDNDNDSTPTAGDNDNDSTPTASDNKDLTDTQESYTSEQPIDETSEPNNSKNNLNDDITQTPDTTPTQETTNTQESNTTDDGQIDEPIITNTAPITNPTDNKEDSINGEITHNNNKSDVDDNHGLEDAEIKNGQSIKLEDLVSNYNDIIEHKQNNNDVHDYEHNSESHNDIELHNLSLESYNLSNILKHNNHAD